MNTILTVLVNDVLPIVLAILAVLFVMIENGKKIIEEKEKEEELQAYYNPNKGKRKKVLVKSYFRTV